MPLFKASLNELFLKIFGIFWDYLKILIIFENFDNF